MYRLLHSLGEVGERRDQATRPAHVKPELCAPAPGQVWAWDITKLHGPQKWSYYYLYVVIDIYGTWGGCSGRTLGNNSVNVIPMPMRATLSQSHSVCTLMPSRTGYSNHCSMRDDSRS
jgi:hypothetical protein